LRAADGAVRHIAAFMGSRYRMMRSDCGALSRCRIGGVSSEFPEPRSRSRITSG